MPSAPTPPPAGPAPSTSSNLNTSRSRMQRMIPRRTRVVFAQDPGPAICPNCRNLVVPDVALKRDACTNFVALVLCILCLCPCALCVYCSPCGTIVYHYCPICKALIKSERVS